MTKDELKRLSDEIFYDNQQGAITPVQHRTFNNKIIENMALTGNGDGSKYLSDNGSYKPFSELNSNVLPSASSTYSLGGTTRVWKNVYTESLGAKDSSTNIQLTSGLSPSVNNLLNLGSETSRFLGFYTNKINGVTFGNTIWKKCTVVENPGAASLYWAVSGNTLLLAGDYTHAGTSTTSINITDIPEQYLNRVLTTNCLLDVKNSSQVLVRVPGTTIVNSNKLVITSSQSTYPFNTTNTFIFFSFIIPLAEDLNEVVREEAGVDYADWNYNGLPQSTQRTRTVKPWTRDVYIDGRVGEKKYGTSYTETEDVHEIMVTEGKWEYTIATDKLSANRKKEDLFKFVYSDFVKDVTVPVTETTTVIEKQGGINPVYEITSDRRTCTKTTEANTLYVFSDYRLLGEVVPDSSRQANLAVVNTEETGRAYGYNFDGDIYVPNNGKEKFITATINDQYPFFSFITHDGEYFIALKTDSPLLYYSNNGIDWQVNDNVASLGATYKAVKSLTVIKDATMKRYVCVVVSNTGAESIQVFLGTIRGMDPFTGSNALSRSIIALSNPIRSGSQDIIFALCKQSSNTGTRFDYYKITLTTSTMPTLNVQDSYLEYTLGSNSFSKMQTNKIHAVNATKFMVTDIDGMILYAVTDSNKSRTYDHPDSDSGQGWVNAFFNLPGQGCTVAIASNSYAYWIYDNITDEPGLKLSSSAISGYCYSAAFNPDVDDMVYGFGAGNFWRTPINRLGASPEVLIDSTTGISIPDVCVLSHNNKYLAGFSESALCCLLID